jgi:hypothetical protein
MTNSRTKNPARRKTAKPLPKLLDVSAQRTEELANMRLGSLPALNSLLRSYLLCVKESVLSNSHTQETAAQCVSASWEMVSLTMSISVLLRMLITTYGDYSTTSPSEIEAAYRVLSGEKLIVDASTYHFEK